MPPAWDDPNVTLETFIQVKISFKGTTRRYQFQLRDASAEALPRRVRCTLQIPEGTGFRLERYSDSRGEYVHLKASDPTVYKTLFRAAKAKLKLRLRVTLDGDEIPSSTDGAKAMPMPSGMPIPPAPLPPSFTAATKTPSPQPNIKAQSLPQRVLVDLPPGHKASAPAPLPVPVSWSSEAAATASALESAFTAPKDSATESQKPPKEAAPSVEPRLAFRLKKKQEASQRNLPWTIFCNNCQESMLNEHWHCSICDNGDYDLCVGCVESGVFCKGESHWIIKRSLMNGHIVNSCTERIPPRAKPSEPQQQSSPAIQAPVPGAYTEDKQSVKTEETAVEEDGEKLTCNQCITVLPKSECVTCITCDEYDLCFSCLMLNEHGHHPAHAFTCVPENRLSTLGVALCQAGRNVRHDAVCDNCQKHVFGVRHKCLACPDWDYCSECFKQADKLHPRHRFVPIYEPLNMTHAVNRNVHMNILCDGPLCKKNQRTYITGLRFKCAVCNDTDFCANCEAHPSNTHNKTHPMIMLKTPVQNVHVTTTREKDGLKIDTLGDREASSPAPINSVTPPKEASAVPFKPIAKSSVGMLSIPDLLSPPLMKPADARPVDAGRVGRAPWKLDAQFVRDTIADGTVIGAGMEFVQSWTVRNPGPSTWPVGTVIRFVGGDKMLNIDTTRVNSTADLLAASQSKALTVEALPGQEYTFRVALKAPTWTRPAISYWRMHSPDGEAFGDRLWCHIKVVPPTEAKSPDASEKYKEHLPTAMLHPNIPQTKLLDMHNFYMHALNKEMERRGNSYGYATGPFQTPDVPEAYRAATSPSVPEKEHVAEPIPEIAAEKMAGPYPAGPSSSSVPENEHDAEFIPYHKRANEIATKMLEDMQPLQERTPRRRALLEKNTEGVRQMYAEAEKRRQAYRDEVMGRLPSYQGGYVRGLGGYLRSLAETKEALAQAGAAQSVKAQTRDSATAETETEAKTTHVIATEEMETEEMKTDEMKTDEMKTDEMKTDEMKTDEMKTDEMKTDEMKTDEMKTEEMKTEEMKTEEKEKKFKKDNQAKVEDETAEAAEAPAVSSGMIFPQLDKESPESSTYEQVAKKPEQAETAIATAAAIETETIPETDLETESEVEYIESVADSSEHSDEFFEDAESVDIRSYTGDEEDDSFMTDEEYDVLHASDEEH